MLIMVWMSAYSFAGSISENGTCSGITLYEQDHCYKLQAYLEYLNNNFNRLIENPSKNPIRQKSLMELYIEKMKVASQKLNDIGVVPKVKVPEIPLDAIIDAPPVSSIYNNTTPNFLKSTEYVDASEAQSLAYASVIGFGAGHEYVALKTGSVAEGQKALAFGLIEIGSIAAENIALWNMSNQAQNALTTGNYNSTAMTVSVSLPIIIFGVTKMAEIIDSPASARRANLNKQGD